MQQAGRVLPQEKPMHDYATLADETSGLEAEFEPIPQSWVDHGGQDHPQPDERDYYAARVAVDERDKTELALVVTYVERYQRGAICYRYSAVRVEEQIVPERVYDHGAWMFPVVISRPEEIENAEISDSDWAAATARYPKLERRGLEVVQPSAAQPPEAD